MRESDVVKDRIAGNTQAQSLRRSHHVTRLA